MRAYFVQVWRPQKYLASNQYPGSYREPEDEKRDRGLDVTTHE